MCAISRVRLFNISGNYFKRPDFSVCSYDIQFAGWVRFAPNHIESRDCITS